jgi:hypothetical protein
MSRAGERGQTKHQPGAQPITHKEISMPEKNNKVIAKETARKRTAPPAAQPTTLTLAQIKAEVRAEIEKDVKREFQWEESKKYQQGLDDASKPYEPSKGEYSVLDYEEWSRIGKEIGEGLGGGHAAGQVLLVMNHIAALAFAKRFSDIETAVSMIGNDICISAYGVAEEVRERLPIDARSYMKESARERIFDSAQELAKQLTELVEAEREEVSDAAN